MTADDNKPNRRRRRWLLAGSVVIGISAMLAVRAHLRHERAKALAEEIFDEGGAITFGPSAIEWFRDWWNGSPSTIEPGTWVFLRGKRIDAAWLQDHDYLTDLSIVDLDLSQSELQAKDAVRLIAHHPLHEYGAIGQQDADIIAFALAGRSRLVHVNLDSSDLTDEGLRRLPLEQLEFLCVYHTRVTPAGLSELRRCRNLRTLSIDGTQFDKTVVATLADLPVLKRVELSGDDVNDENVRHVATLQNLKSLHLEKTSVTDSAIEKLKQAMPGTLIDDEIGSAE